MLTLALFLLAVVAGSLGGYALAVRRFGGLTRTVRYLSEDTRRVLHDVRQVAERAEPAAELAPKADAIARRALRETQAAAKLAAETAARQTELERAIAANYGIQLTK